jgi:hypothetical protein
VDINKRIEIAQEADRVKKGEQTVRVNKSQRKKYEQWAEMENINLDSNVDIVSILERYADFLIFNCQFGSDQSVINYITTLRIDVELKQQALAVRCHPVIDLKNAMRLARRAANTVKTLTRRAEPIRLRHYKQADAKTQWLLLFMASLGARALTVCSIRNEHIVATKTGLCVYISTIKCEDKQSSGTIFLPCTCGSSSKSFCVVCHIGRSEWTFPIRRDTVIDIMTRLGLSLHSARRTFAMMVAIIISRTKNMDDELRIHHVSRRTENQGAWCYQSTMFAE